MADVHLGHDTRLGRQVAIKILRSDLARDANFLTRFRREAQSAAGLNHPSIVAIFDSGEDENTDDQGMRRILPYIVMEHVDGHTLRDRLAEVGRLEPEQAIMITEDVLDALAYSHRMGIVHRDIKPANVMITESGQIKVMDFGIARAIADTAATMTQTHSVVGTAQYLSPEQATGQSIDARSDIYSAGCMLFELLTGRPPFTGDSPVAIAYQHVGETPQPPSAWQGAIGSDLDAVTLHALTKDRDARYQDAAAFREDLERVRLGRPISAAALGAGAAAGAAAGVATTQLLSTDDNATQLLPADDNATQLLPADDNAPTVVQPPVGDPTDLGDPTPQDTSDLPDVGRELGEGERNGRGGRAAIITIIIIAVLGLLGWGAVNWYTSQTPETIKVTVPDLRGMTEQQADGALASRNLQGESSRGASDAPEGQVFEQSPANGESVDENSVVAYTISTGPEALSIPNVTGKTSDEAIAELRKAGFTNFKVVSEDDPAQDKGKVINTNPAAGESVSKDALVELHVATGNVVVPDDLVGQDWAEVPVRFSALKLKPKKVDVETADKPAGTVLDVAKAGSAVPVGTEIEVKVAQAGPPTPSVTTATVTVTQEPTTPPPPGETKGG
ncbi:MAG: Stk1 family PASTA domain-containing Ser/Thr kinase [Micrococcales bacterium]|nr:Stk1 family PASTA domain-containing Ser/Thr kinase [Micrococcales bacterium]